MWSRCAYRCCDSLFERPPPDAGLARLLSETTVAAGFLMGHKITRPLLYKLVWVLSFPKIDTFLTSAQ